MIELAGCVIDLLVINILLELAERRSVFLNPMAPGIIIWLAFLLTFDSVFIVIALY